MTTEERRALLDRAITAYGAPAQMDMAVEEMAELTKALCKVKRVSCAAEAKAVLENVVEEMADVQIMLDQLRIIFHRSTEEVEEAKLERLKVSSRAPVWGASRPGSIWQSWATFQVVPPCGGHHEAALAQVLADGFKSCPRVGGIHDLLRLSFADCGFQVVPPCGGHL